MLVAAELRSKHNESFAFSSKHKHRQQAYFTGGGFGIVLKVVDIMQLGNNDTTVAPDMNTERGSHSIVLLDIRRAPDNGLSSAADSLRARCSAYRE